MCDGAQHLLHSLIFTQLSLCNLQSKYCNLLFVRTKVDS
jgi:hypothetical protein